MTAPTRTETAPATHTHQPTPHWLGWLKWLLFIACLLPVADLALRLLQGTLAQTTADPAEFTTRTLGAWAFRFLLLTLAISPLRRLLGWHWLLRLRRMLGLFVFFYALLHLASYLWYEHRLAWPEIANDIVRHPLITLGVAAFILLLPLAATSNKHMVRRLGGQRWQELHRSLYLIALFVLVHYWAQTEDDVRHTVLHVVILLSLLAIRAWWRAQERRRQLTALPPPYKPRGKVIPINPR
ncbi:MAG: sulfoxide reductase heme-binding subunit YedZ [Sterolibacterium sp.]|nr:sulfoxide reductase heme-binding subunit YedZ [Sterolibacterium sp.]